MVGVPRSRGCSICIKRRVKCDETRPSCAKCNTYGVSCPGYDRPFKFVDRVHRRPQSSSSLKEASAPESGNAGSTNSDPSSSNTISMTLYRESGNGIVPSISSPGACQVQCLSTWIEDVSWTQVSVPDTVIVARLFRFIPSRLGMSNALDLAVRCLTVHHLGITRGNEDIIRHGRLAYGNALCSLQKAIYDPSEAIKSETLCATIILCFYELFAATTVDSWMKHAGGVRKLMLLRGPKHFQNEFDGAMLMAFKGLLITEALFSAKACFLDLEEWKYIALQPPDDSFSAQFYEKSDELARCIAACPWLIKEMYGLRRVNKSDISTLVRVAALVHRTLEVYGRLQQWYEDFTAFVPLPEEVRSSTDDPLYPMVYHYWNSCTASAFCGYYTTIIILHVILMDCHHPAGDPERITLMVDEICKSIEYMAGTGILGPFRVGFSMRIAFEAATVTTKLWIRKWLNQFEKFYKVCSPDNYPPIEAVNETSTPIIP